MAEIKKAVTKKVKPKEVVVIHSCTEAKTLERICLVLFGNGHPEDGLAFLVRDYIKNMDGIKSDVADIKLKLSLVTEVNNELEIHNRVRVAVEKEREIIKDELIRNNEKIVDRKQFSWTKFSIVVGALAFIVMAIFQVLNYSHNIEIKEATVATESKVDELGSPVVVNPRGEFVPLPDGFSLKMYPNDFDEGVIDTIKR